MATVFVVLAAFLLLAARSWGQAASAPQPVDVALEVHALEPESSTFRKIVISVVQSRLDERGLTSVVLEDSAAADAKAPSAARAAGAVALLACRYSAAGTTLDLSFAWVDLDLRTSQATFEKTGPLDINMDEVVLAGLDGLLAQEKDRIESLAAARASRQAKTAATVSPAPAQQPAAAKTPDASPVSAAAAPAAASSPPPVPATAPAGVPPAPMRFELRAGGTAFVPLGPASDYFAVAGGPSLQGSLDFPVLPGRFAVGLFTSSIIFSAVGPAETATGFLVPIGPDARYTIGNGVPFSVFAHLSIGPAVLVLITASQGAGAGLTGYLKSGFGAGYTFGHGFGVELTVDYEVYFEQPYMIMGVSSTLQATIVL